ncbi:MAG: carbamoyltransferase HypF [Acidimicrobiales bacterium]|nr:carbamoyltransferase HypF [Acidimicrobiales bacterium]
MDDGAPELRRRVAVRGVVQGVGFRPFVHGLAARLGLTGFVGNDRASVFIEVEGTPAAVRAFERALVDDAPPLAVIDAVEAATVPATGAAGFAIVASRAGAGGTTLVPPDVATCDDCLREVLDPHDRRHRYPFTNCTACGPRFTIIESLPYDRPATTMAGFAMCPACEREYHDPADRRFHAQPNACPACGPRLALRHPSGSLLAEGDDALVAARAQLAGGRIVAVKGLGGYHLACDATDAAAVARLRERKARGGKPFALLVADVATARRLCHVGDDEADLLESRARPIVLLAKRGRGAPAAHEVAPDNPFLGVMLPSTPLHHLLVRPLPGSPPAPEILVLTSGNLADEPIAHEDADALIRLARLADAFCTHDRPIHVPCDDSVVRLVEGAELAVRRSRGYAPFPVRLPGEVRPVLAVGGELKTTFCVAAGTHAWLSQHIGDMGSLETLWAFERSVEQFERTYGIAPEVLACDAHPAYQTTRWAERAAAALSVPLVRVQHHRAHVASLLAEHGEAPDTPLLGVAFDGTGFGDDGSIWGGEVLMTGAGPARRAAHLAPVPLPGGDAAVARPSRSALAHLWAAGIAWDEALPAVAACPPTERAVVASQLESPTTVRTSSMGRLVDAVAALAGVRQACRYEAEAAIELEGLVAGEPADPYRFTLRPGDPVVLDPAPVIAAVAADVRAGTPPAVVAARFHAAVADVVAATASHLRAVTGIGRVGLTGGVFQNVTILRWSLARLRSEGFEVLVHRRVPPNDGGLALGQAVLAAST